MSNVGVACIDITPPAGLPMAGFAARRALATGAHDALTVRALAIDDIVLLVADVIGLDRALCQRVGRATGLGPTQLLLAASHTHGGPPSMPERLSQDPDRAFMERLEQACILAVTTARATRGPATLHLACAQEPDFARNRRHEDGAVDRIIPVLRADRPDGSPLALFVVCACHPVVLGANNLLWTADYPHFMRQALERDLAGAVVICATGFAGDVNTGHSAAASLNTQAQSDRTFARAQAMGEALAAAVMQADLRPVAGSAWGAAQELSLDFERLSDDPIETAQLYRRQARCAAADQAHLLDIWARWSETRPLAPPPHRVDVQVLALGTARFIGLPGEIFAQVALDLRASLPDQTLFLIGYAGDNPGYIAPAAEYAFGGYEIHEAHRFYAMPAAFQAGASEKLRAAAQALCRMQPDTAKNQPQGKQA